ncbi:MAG: response regulator transcription factor, partial [Pseudomonas sp.]
WDVPPIFYLAMITLIKCELWLAQGRTDLAESWLLRLGQTYGGKQPAAAPEFHPLLPVHIELQQALLLRTQGRLEQAGERLQALVARGQANGGHLLCVTALCPWIELLLANHHDAQARDLLVLSLEAARGGALQPFQRLLKLHPLWLRDQLLAQPASATQASLLALLPALEPAQEVSGNCEALSARERAVLELIAQGCSNQEISERLFISLHTVKTHASHINSKLGVERRTQAVARAKALGLLA